MNTLKLPKSFKTIIILTVILLLLVSSIMLATPENEDRSNYQNFKLTNNQEFNGKVLIVGAGAAGLTAGYLLDQQGIDYTIIEATDRFGGRIQEDTEFADFPIDLGAEWIHEDPIILNYIVGMDKPLEDIEIINYQPQSIYNWDGEKLTDESHEADSYKEYKFKDTTWFSFYKKYIVPRVEDKIVYNRAVSQIDYASDLVKVRTVDGSTFKATESYTADNIIVTVPISILQDEYIEFSPELPPDKIEALDSLGFADGMKMYMEFDDKFYPDVLLISEDSDEFAEDDIKIYYDAAYGKDSSQNILGLLVVGYPSEKYLNMSSEEDVIDSILEELDKIYNGRASELFVNYRIQNWSEQRYTRGTYVTDFEADYLSAIRTLKTPIKDKIYFAGSGLAEERISTVPGAAETAYETVNLILNK